MSTFEDEDLARAAGALVRDAAVKEVLRRLEERHVSAWKHSDPDNVSAREDAYRMVRALDDVRSQLQALSAEPSVSAFNRRLKRG